MAMGNVLCLEVGEILVHSVWTGYLGSLAAMLVNVSSILHVASHWYLFTQFANHFTPKFFDGITTSVFFNCWRRKICQVKAVCLKQGLRREDVDISWDSQGFSVVAGGGIHKNCLRGE